VKFFEPMVSVVFAFASLRWMVSAAGSPPAPPPPPPPSSSSSSPQAARASDTAASRAMNVVSQLGRFMWLLPF
jgi:hypothetical protein